jgi:hypothetical protein
MAKNNWSLIDNPRYIGKIDRQYVARSEPWEADEFIKEYVKTRGLLQNHGNYAGVADAMEDCPLPAPITRVALTAWLDKHLGRTEVAY